MRVIKKICIICIVVIVLSFWAVQVYRVNKNAKLPEERYHVGDMLSYEDWDITYQDSVLMTSEDFRKNFSKYSGYITDDYVLLLELDVCYQGEEVLEIPDIVNTFTSTGFQSGNWFNGIDPFSFQEMNQKAMEDIQLGKTSTIYVLGDINNSNLSTKYKKTVLSRSYEYVLDLYPKKIKLLIND